MQQIYLAMLLKNHHINFFVLLFGCFLFVLSIIVCTQHGAHSECIVHALSRSFFHANIVVHFFVAFTYMKTKQAANMENTNGVDKGACVGKFVQLLPLISNLFKTEFLEYYKTCIVLKQTQCVQDCEFGFIIFHRKQPFR